MLLFSPILFSHFPLTRVLLCWLKYPYSVYGPCGLIILYIQTWLDSSGFKSNFACDMCPPFSSYNSLSAKSIIHPFKIFSMLILSSHCHILILAFIPKWWFIYSLHFDWALTAGISNHGTGHRGDTWGQHNCGHGRGCIDRRFQVKLKIRLRRMRSFTAGIPDMNSFYFQSSRPSPWPGYSLRAWLRSSQRSLFHSLSSSTESVWLGAQRYRWGETQSLALRSSAGGRQTNRPTSAGRATRDRDNGALGAQRGSKKFCWAVERAALGRFQEKVTFTLDPERWVKVYQLVTEDD